MGKQSTSGATHATQGLLMRIRAWVVLVPEGAIIAGLLILFVGLGSWPPLIGVIVLATCWFFARLLGLHLARLALEYGRYREAAAFLTLTRALYPGSPDALALSGALELAQGNPGLAEQYLRRAAERLPQQPNFYIAHSGALLELGFPAEAAAVALRALALEPRSAIAYLYLAEADRMLGASAEGIESALRAGLAVASTPEISAVLQCALASHLFTEQRSAEGMLALRGVESLLPRCAANRQAAIRLHLAELLTAQGQIERAKEHFQGIEAIDPQGRYAAAAWRGARL